MIDFSSFVSQFVENRKRKWPTNKNGEGRGWGQFERVNCTQSVNIHFLFIATLYIFNRLKIFDQPKNKEKILKAKNKENKFNFKLTFRTIAQLEAAQQRN